MWLFDTTIEEIKSLFLHREDVQASSKAEAVVKKIISAYPNPISLPELMQLRVNGSKLASVSTHISDWRPLARKLGYEIKNYSKHGKVFRSEYVAVPIQ